MMFIRFRSIGERVKRSVGLFILMVGLMMAASAVLSSHGLAASDSIKIDSTTRIFVDQDHPARTVDVDVAAGNYSNLQVRDITVAEAEAIAGQQQDRSASVHTDVASKNQPIHPDSSNATCHSHQAVVDPVGIELTSVQHDTNWNYNPGVSLVWLNTAAGYHWSTGWSITSGPNQWQVSSSRTHGDASFQWLSPSGYPHTLSNDNQEYSDGSCLGIMAANGSVPLISHLSRTVWVTH